MAVLTEEERKDLYSKLLAKKQGRSETEKASIAGGVLQGITNIAQAGTGVNTDVSSNLQKVGEARDKTKASKADEYRKLLGMDRQARLDEQRQAREQAADQLSQDKFQFSKDRAGIQDRLRQEQIDVNRGNLEEIKRRNDAMLQLKRDQLAAKPEPVSIEDKAQISKLAQSTASKTSILNQLQSAGAKFDEALEKGDTDLAVTLGRQMLKTLNSTEGADAVGAEEAKRLGGLLEFKIGNVFEPGSFIGRDLDKFSEQIKQTSAGIEDAIKANRQSIADVKGETIADDTDEDSQALQWAKENPNDPRAKQILEMLGQ